MVIKKTVSFQNPFEVRCVKYQFDDWKPELKENDLAELASYIVRVSLLCPRNLNPLVPGIH